MDEQGEQGLEWMETRAQQFVDPLGGHMLVETYMARDVVTLVAEVRRLRAALQEAADNELREHGYRVVRRGRRVEVNDA